MPTNKKKKKIKAGKIEYISLCPYGATGVETLFKEASSRSMENQVEALLQAKYSTDDNYVYVHRMFPLSSYAIYGSNGTLWKIGYNLSSQELVGEPVAVVEEENYVEMATLSKEGEDFDEKGVIIACVYPPNQADADGHFADEDAIQTMMQSFAKDGKGLDIRHNCETLEKEAAYVVESFTIQKEDPRFTDFKDYSGDPVDVTGGWGMVIKIDDPDLRQKYRDGEWKGVSLYGDCLVETVAKDDKKENFLMAAVHKIAKAMKVNLRGMGDWSTSSTKPNQEEELDVDAKELVAAIAESQGPLLAAMETLAKEVKGLAPKQTPDAPKPAEDDPANKQTPAGSTIPVKKEAPAPEDADFDVTSLKDPAKVQERIQAIRLKKMWEATDVNDPDSLERLQKSLEAAQKNAPAPAATEEEEEDPFTAFSTQTIAKEEVSAKSFDENDPDEETRTLAKEMGFKVGSKA